MNTRYRLTTIVPTGEGTRKRTFPHPLTEEEMRRIESDVQTQFNGHAKFREEEWVD